MTNQCCFSSESLHLIGVLGADSCTEAQLHTCIDGFLLPFRLRRLIGYLTARQEALSMAWASINTSRYLLGRFSAGTFFFLNSSQLFILCRVNL